jgi:hypothetical protein
MRRTLLTALLATAAAAFTACGGGSGGNSETDCCTLLGDGPEPAEWRCDMGGAWCEVNGTNAEHVAAGRAYAIDGMAYAMGSADALGPADGEHTYCICSRAPGQWSAGDC